MKLPETAASDSVEPNPGIYTYMLSVFQYISKNGRMRTLTQSLLSFLTCRYNLIWPRNVTEFSYRYDSSKNSQATVLMSFQPVPNIDTDFDDVMQELGETRQ